MAGVIWLLMEGAVMGKTIYTEIFADSINIEYCEWVAETTNICTAGIKESVETGFDVVSGFNFQLNMNVKYFNKTNAGFITFSLTENTGSENCKQIEHLLRANGYKFILPCAKVTKSQIIRASILHFDEMETYLKTISPCKPADVGKRKAAKLKSVAA